LQQDIARFRVLDAGPQKKFNSRLVAPIFGKFDAFQVSPMLVNREDLAEALARKHYEVESGLTHVYHIQDKLDLSQQVCVEHTRAAPIRLLEVNENTVPSGIMPLSFGPAPASGITLPSVIVEVTPAEFARIQSDDLQLPEGWAVGKLIPKFNGVE